MSITVNSHSFSVFGDKAAVVADLAFSGVYARGGISLDHDQELGLHSVEIALLESRGYSFQHDAANKKVKIFGPAPPIVYEEHQIADTSGLITLRYPCAFVMNAAIPGQNLVFRSTGVTPAANQIALTSQMEDGELTEFKVLGTDGLSGDGAFTGAATNWTLAAGWTYATNDVDHDGAGVGTLAHNNFAAVVGLTYKLTFTISDWTAGTSVTPTLGGTAGTAITAAGTYVENIKATTTAGLTFTPTTDVRCTIDSVTVYNQDVYVTYITQAWRDVWANLVQDESITLATGANTLTSLNKILACMYVDQTTATAAALTMLDEDDTVASGEVEIAFNAIADHLTVHSDQNAKVALITYIKRPAAGFLHERAFYNEGSTKSGADPYINTFDYPLLLWGYTGQLPVSGGATLYMIEYAGTPATGEFVVDWFNPGVRGAAGPQGTIFGLKDNVAGTGAGVWGRIDEIETAALELVDMDLAVMTSVKALFIGT